MTADISRRSAAFNLRGSLFMTAAMAGFAVEDALIKATARAVPVGMVLLAFGLSGLLAFGLMCRRAAEPPVAPAMLSRPMLARSAFEVLGRVFYTLAIALTPVSTASAILQASPLLVVAGAAVLFGERVGLLRWAAVLAGFVGVMLIIQPGADGFSMLSLLTVLGLIGFAGRDLATRAAPPALSHRQLGFLGFLGVMGAGLILLPFGGPLMIPSGLALAGMLAAAVAGVSAYYALTIAMRTGEIAAVTPFRYTRLLFALAIGIVFFAERPDLLTVVGSMVVVAAGLVALLARR